MTWIRRYLTFVLPFYRQFLIFLETKAVLTKLSVLSSFILVHQTSMSRFPRFLPSQIVVIVSFLFLLPLLDVRESAYDSFDWICTIFQVIVYFNVFFVVLLNSSELLTWFGSLLYTGFPLFMWYLIKPLIFSSILIQGYAFVTLLVIKCCNVKLFAPVVVSSDSANHIRPIFVDVLVLCYKWYLSFSGTICLAGISVLVLAMTQYQ